MTSPTWDGFADPYFNLGQLLLWAATRNPAYVDAASDRSGLYEPSYGLVAAAVQIEEQIPVGEGREELCEEIRQKAMEGVLKGYDYGVTPPRELPPHTWLKLEIVFESQSGIPFVRWRGHSSIVPAYDVRFSRTDALQSFPATDNPGHEEYWVLPDEPPSQESQRTALKGLRRAFRDGRIPKSMTAERLAQIASTKLGLERDAVTREAVLRLLGRKK